MPPKNRTRGQKRPSNNPAGRPPKSREDRRDVLVRALATEEEARELKVAADAAGLSLSAWLLSVALKAARAGGGGRRGS